ncbi:P-type transport ATPase (probable substrate copper/metal cation) [Natrialba magadii ATCC 43099]|uniref:ATPase P n=1 Tax=Natrialba magadii (strain ATCC 43099 / DSM 3394 / CCM 3739 / CIP 104546 / IAM 13178 / JCM 8861 / NBRC 102185 / NCIMB 2190 / MS3) TaxID=547559 RepID=D3SXU7_NATMM|nr:cation-translocating P-type ATPase [Natrialba magadii]ADD03987.1 P-type transport ATPase (probable substrate copper/metal cation) [Natrialba magadii ATCC 43099]ELY33646.1 ATPase P [Natrialba magadii ATCC 43099]
MTETNDTNRDPDATADSDTGCTLCELPVEGSGVVDDGNAFCCVGCRDVYDALGDVEDVDATDIRDARSAPDAESEGKDEVEDRTVPPGHETTFLEVDGMYCATCEAFIESVASNTEGVSHASSSYVTDTARIDHDPETVSVETLKEEISKLGYSAYDREDAISRRRADNWEMGRVAVGVLMGMMVMMQYIVIIYPTYFGGLFYDDRTTEFLTEALASGRATPFYIGIAALTTIILMITGKPILQGAYVAIKTRSPNMDLLVSIAAISAYLYSTLSIVVGDPELYYDVTVAIIVIVTVGGYYESTLKRKAMDRLSDLTAVQVDEARRVYTSGDGDTSTAIDSGTAVDSSTVTDDENTDTTSNGETTVAVDELESGDHVLVRTGERIPIDGTVVGGQAAVDEAVVTGESLPVTKESGDEVVGGSIVSDGSLTVAVGEDATSTLDRISELVWDLQSGTHGIQKLADKLATIFVPLVLVLAFVVTSIYLLLGASIADALLVGLTVLIVSCPCALGLATPLAVAAGIRDALERSIVVFDDSVFERIRNADTVVFDKTGTLTTGDMTVVDTDLADDLLEQAAVLESRSAHPVGEAIAAATPASPVADGGAVASSEDELAVADGEATEEGRETGGDDRIDSFESHRNGVSGVVDGDDLIVGHPDLFRDRGWTVPGNLAEQIADARETGRVPVAVGRNGAADGLIVVGDDLREGWDETLTAISESGTDIVVLTGDDRRAAAQFREHDAVDQVFAGVPPEGKAETVDRLKRTGQTVMIGDGTNDAPALASADLGVALGGGTAMAADAADVALVDDDLSSVDTVFELARATDRRVKGNIGWAFCYNAIAIPLAVTGLLNPLFAAIAMGASSLLVVTNSSRPLLD